MPIPAQSFVNSLKGLDPLLSVYWGETIGKWIVARKGVIPIEEVGLLVKRQARLERLVRSYDGSPMGLKKMEEKRKEVTESVRAAKNGKRIVLFSAVLSPQLYDQLVLADMTRYGGYSFFADQMEQAEAKAEMELERKQREQRMALNKEVYDMLNFVWRKREDALLNGERDLGKLVHGQKSGPSPLVQLTDF